MTNQISLLNNDSQDKSANIAGAETIPSVAGQVQEAVKNQGVFTSTEKSCSEPLNRDVVVEEVLTEAEKAEKTAELISIIKFVKGRFPNAGLDDIYQQLNELTTRLKFKRELKQFETDFEKLLIQLVKRCAQHDVAKAIGVLSFIGSTDSAGLVEIAKICAQKDPKTTIELIEQFGITDEPALIEIAKVCAEKNGAITAFNISKFKITDQKALIQIAMLSVRQSAGAAVQYLNRFRIKDNKGLAEILMVAARLHPKETAAYIKRNCNSKESSQLLQALLVCLQTDPTALGDFSAKSTIFIMSKTFSLRLDFIIENLPELERVGLNVYEQVLVIQRYLLTQQKGDFYDLCVSLLKPNDPEQQESQLAQIQLIGAALILMEYNGLTPSQMQKLLQTPLMLTILKLPSPYLRWRLMRQCITGAAQDDFVDKISASSKTGSWQWILAMLLERACTQGCSETTARQIMEVSSHRLFKDGKIHRMLLETLLLLVENQNLTGPSKEQLLLKLIAPLQKKVLENAESQKIPSREAINMLGAEEKKALKTQMNAQKGAKRVSEKESIYLFIEGTSHLLAFLAINDPMIKEVNDNRSLRDLLQASFEKLLPLQDKANFGEKYLNIFGQNRFPTALPVYAAKLKTLNDNTVLKDLALFVESVLNGTFLQLRHSCDKNPHLQQIAKSHPDELKKWFQEIPSLEMENFVVIDTEEPIDLMLAGTEVIKSCQHTNGDPKLNKGLLGYLLDGKIRMIAIKSKKGPEEKIIGRAMIKLMWDGEKPVLFLDKFYLNQPSPQNERAIIEMAKRKAQSLGVDLVSADGSGEPYGKPLQALGGPASFEYSDAVGTEFGLVCPKGQYTTKNDKRI